MQPDRFILYKKYTVKIEILQSFKWLNG